MKSIFIVKITQGNYEDRTERVLIFSSLEKVLEWKESYKTPYKNFEFLGEECGVVKEISIDDNELLSISDSFTIPVEEPSQEELDEFNDFMQSMCW